LEASVKGVGVEKVEHVDFGKALPVFRILRVGSQSAFDMLPMVV
jgi:hypothetical protein